MICVPVFIPTQKKQAEGTVRLRDDAGYLTSRVTSGDLIVSLSVPDSTRGGQAAYESPARTHAVHAASRSSEGAGSVRRTAPAHVEHTQIAST